MRRLSLLAVLAALLATPALAQEVPPLPKVSWSFQGPFGTFNEAALQRGFQVYKEVCSNCHSLNLVHYRDLAGIGLNEAEIKAVAASVQVPGGIDKQGKPFDRPGRPADAFRNPWPNPEAAIAVFGIQPPDLSLMANARVGGPTYIYALMNGFKKPPAGMKVLPGHYYNEYFPGHQIAMPPPLHAGVVTYADHTKATVPQMAHDVATFLDWAANPEMQARKQLGVHIVLFLVFLTGLTYAVKRKIWSDVH